MCGKMNNGDMLILFLITFFGAIIFTYCIKRILLNARIADNPIVSEHRHKSGTPTMGGIAFLFVILLIIAIYYNNTPILIMSYIMLAGGIVGLLDDLIGLKVKEIQKVVVNCCDEVITLGRLDVEPNEEVRVATPKAKKEIDNLILMLVNSAHFLFMFSQISSASAAFAFGSKMRNSSPPHLATISDWRQDSIRIRPEARR